jgi:hypothetical protein
MICKQSQTFAKVPHSMIRRRGRSGRIARLLVCVSAALAAAAPAAASAQPAVDEYTLDIPGGGGGGDSADPGASTGAGAGVASAGGDAGVASAGGDAGGGGDGSSKSTESGARDTEAGSGGGAAQGDVIEGLNPFHDGTGSTSANGSLEPSSRSAPEVVADTLTDGATLPILAALLVITGAGAWRVLRQRRTLSGQAG